MDRAWQLAPGVVIRASGGSPEAGALAEIFPAFEVVAAEGTPRLTTRVRSDGALRVSLDGQALFSVADDELAPALEAALIGWVVRTRAGVVPLHASALAWAGRAVLFLGDKGSGKSTLAAQLGAELPYLGDEISFVRIPDLVLAPFPKAATIKHGAFAVLPASPGSRTWRDPLRGPVRYHAPAVTSRAELPPGALVWPQWGGDVKTATMAPLAREEVAVRLIHQSFGGLERDPRTLDVIVELSTRPAFELSYSTAGAARAVLEEALGPP